MMLSINLDKIIIITLKNLLFCSLISAILTDYLINFETFISPNTEKIIQ